MSKKGEKFELQEYNEQIDRQYIIFPSLMERGKQLMEQRKSQFLVI